MILSRFFVRRRVRSSRPGTIRRPGLEALEGRQLLSTCTSSDMSLNFTKISASVSTIQGNHIGASASMIQGNHIGTSVT
jgi:hypothetical protein